MKERVFKTKIAEFVTHEWTGENPSGLTPPNDMVVVIVDYVPEKTKGGILMPEQAKDDYTRGSELGVLVACGPAAFKWDRDRHRPWEGWTFKPGDHIAFQRYAGQDVFGKDGKIYRLMQDSAIGCRLDY